MRQNRDEYQWHRTTPQERNYATRPFRKRSRWNLARVLGLMTWAVIITALAVVAW